MHISARFAGFKTTGWTHIADLFLRLLQSQELRCVRDLGVSFPFVLLKFLLVVNLQSETTQILVDALTHIHRVLSRRK